MKALRSTLSLPMFCAAVLLQTLFSPSAASGQHRGNLNAPQADLIIHHAKVWTVDPQQPQAQAVAVIGDKIVAVGNNQDILKWRGVRTRMIDAKGRRLLPGFNDAHVHFGDGGNSLSEVDLKDADSPNEFAQRIASHAARLPATEWVTGGNWDDQAFRTPQLPTRQMIDALTSDRPVFVTRYDGHMAVANSMVLKMAGISKDSPEVPGGEIVRDKHGEPTGLLRDAAMDAVFKVMPAQNAEQRLRNFRAGLQHAAEHGVTSMQDMNPSLSDIALYAQLAEQEQLTARLYVAPMLEYVDDVSKLGIRRGFGTPYLRMGAFKTYADGSLGSSTAYFFKPYLDTPETRGMLSAEMLNKAQMRERLWKADAAGNQICIHAIGDAGIAEALDLIAALEKEHGPRDRRIRIEHAQHLGPHDFQRFHDLQVIASVQPYHAIDDGRFVDKRIGFERGKRSYAFRSFLQHGVRLAMGTDWTVAPLNPLETIAAAVNREVLSVSDAKHKTGAKATVWLPEQKLTVAEAVYAYTMGSAYAEFQEQAKGSVSRGKYADLVLLSRDIFSIPTGDIKAVQVDMTLIGGKIVFERARTKVAKHREQ
ncbi:MAG: amidohydrolase [Burkholderiaceae bacterium]|nr:MAG: amidohydrolase [Burkholderiaceae bacterium]